MVDNPTIGYSLEGLFVLAGLAILIAHFIRRRRHPAPPVFRLPPRNAPTGDVLFFLLATVVPMGLGFASSAFAARHYPSWGLGKIQLGGAYIQEFAMIAAVVVYLITVRPASRAEAPLGAPPPPAGAPAGPLPAISTGIITFLAAMPLVFLVSLAWQGILTLCNFSPAHQTIVDLFLGLDTPVTKILFIFLAGVLVPCNEEMIFRAGLFRGLRAGVPRVYAVAISAIVFGAAHADVTSFVPLVTLGVVFALAYERTGNIGTVIVAHALFNLNTLLALLLGVNA